MIFVHYIENDKDFITKILNLSEEGSVQKTTFVCRDHVLDINVSVLGKALKLMKNFVVLRLRRISQKAQGSPR